MACPTWPDTGPVQSWMDWAKVSPDEVLGWAAVYCDGSGGIAQARVYTSVDTAWSTHVTDPETLPTEHMQCYLVTFKRRGSLYNVWLDGFDTYHLIGKTQPVTGTLLADADWSAMQQLLRTVWEQRATWDR